MQSVEESLEYSRVDVDKLEEFARMINGVHQHVRGDTTLVAAFLLRSVRIYRALWFMTCVSVTRVLRGTTCVSCFVVLSDCCRSSRRD